MRVDDYIKREGQSSIETHKLTNEELERLQRVEIEIASDIIRLCEANDIDYMLGGGSCLGAMRHNGFIPWDDDIDLNMTLKGWQRLKPLIETRFSDKYWIWCPETDADINAIKIFFKGTEFRELGNPSNDHGGIFVDIFVIQNVPNNWLLRSLQGVLSLGARYICSCVRLYHQREFFEEAFAGNAEALAGYRRRFAVGRFFSFIRLDGWVKLYARIDCMCKNDSSRYVTIPTGMRMYFGELMPRNQLFPTRTHIFAGHEWKVPHDADAYLTKLYGDWKQMPPEDQRERHLIISIDFGSAGESNE